MSSDMTRSWQRFIAAFNANSIDDVADVIAAEFFVASFISIERFENGRLVERWEVGDVLGVLRQLGALPPS